MPETPRQIEMPKLIVGEGKDELRFFGALIRQLGIDDIQVEEYGGKNNLRSYIRTLCVRPNFGQLTSIGITRDADEHADHAFQSIVAGLQHAGLPTPTRPEEFVGDKPRIGVFILPDGKQGGMLEDLCWQDVADTEKACIDTFFQCIEGVVQRQPRNMSKARLGAWLSTLAEPTRRLGEAADIRLFFLG